ncbi:hypothetical protein ACFTAO_39575 [Paenibacillus rhizoplanae]
MLTAKGTAACRSMLEIKQKIEAEITARIGREQVELLRTLLTQDWL